MAYSKLLIRTWIGELPEWTPRFLQSVERLRAYGWDFKIVNLKTKNDIEDFEYGIYSGLGIQVNSLTYDLRKVCEFDPALPHIFPFSALGYDFWGHFNLDCVYGRLDHFFPDSFLDTLDIYADDLHSICGPFTLYRNCDKVNNLFRLSPRWEDIMSDATFHGFDEGEFADIVRLEAAKGNVRFRTGHTQSHDKIEGHRVNQGGPKLTLDADGTLKEFGQSEISFFHFNEWRKWPL